MVEMSNAERIEKLKSYQLKDPELERLKALTQPFLDTLQLEFGSRDHIAVVNVVALLLAHALADPDEGFPALCCVNDWLTVIPRHHGGVEYRVVWRRHDGSWETQDDS
jgi:hypothetical protein